MRFINSRMETNNNETVIYLDLHPEDEEFAQELGVDSTETKEEIEEKARGFVRNRFPRLQNNALVKVMLGALMVASFTMGAKEVSAAPVPVPPKVKETKTGAKFKPLSSKKRGRVQILSLAKPSIVSEAEKFIGVRYRWGGTSPSTGFDCSGFVEYVLNHCGYHLPRERSADLYHAGSPVSRYNLRPGDLVFFAMTRTGHITHVGIYIGNNKFISATTSKGVAVYRINDSYWGPHYVGARRLPSPR